MIKAIENPYTHIISHPGDGTAKLLLNRLCRPQSPSHPAGNQQQLLEALPQQSGGTAQQLRDTPSLQAI